MMIALPCLANAEQSSGGSQPRPLILLQKGNPHDHIKRPKSPDRQLITCEYDGINMELNFTVNEGISTLTVTDESPQCLTYTIDTSTLNASVSVGLLYGSIIIQLDTERGNHFSGVIE